MVAEPDSTRQDRSELMDFIWECLIKWEETDGPEELLDGSFRPAGRPVTTVEELYVMAFNDLRKSCRLNRREGGPRGYVKAVQEFVAKVLASDPDLEELLDPAVPVPGTMDFEPLFEKRGYRISLQHTPSGDPAVDKLIYESESEKGPSVSEFEAYLKQYPNNRLLRAEYAVALGGAARTEDAIQVWHQLLKETPDHPYYLSAYLDLLLRHDNDQGFEEAERLDFQFELNKYPFDAAGGYSLAVLLLHSSACINMALHGQDMAYALELFDDLVRAGIPAPLLTSIGSTFILLELEELSDEEVTDDFPLDYLAEDYPDCSYAVAFLESQWDLVSETLSSVSPLLEYGHHYPNAASQQHPWPRNPGTVDEALQLRVNIIDSSPEIYRTIVVPDDTLLPDLHGMLQVAFDWEERHLHEFIHGKTHYGKAGPEASDREIDYRNVRIGHLLKQVGDELIYHYDFGDSWKHRIVLEAIPEVDDVILYPRCIAGARRGPKEDSGGIYGYQQLLKNLEDPTHPDYEDLREWIGEDFDPEEFVLAWTHKQLWKGRFWHLGGE